MKILLIIDFHTGDSDTPYWHVPTVLECDNYYKTMYDIESAITTFTEENEYMEYEEIVESVMKKMHNSLVDWKFTNGFIPQCDCMHTIWV